MKKKKKIKKMERKQKKRKRKRKSSYIEERSLLYKMLKVKYNFHARQI